LKKRDLKRLKKKRSRHDRKEFAKDRPRLPEFYRQIGFDSDRRKINNEIYKQWRKKILPFPAGPIFPNVGYIGGCGDSLSHYNYLLE
jgi:hypothetical protein